MKPRILVIDDEAAIRDSLRMILEYEDYQFVGAATGQEGIAAVQRERPDLVLLEINRRPVRSAEDFRRLMADVHSGDVLTLYVFRPGSGRALLTVKID